MESTWTATPIGKIRRVYFVQGKPIKAISRELRVSQKVIRKVLRTGATQFEYGIEARPVTHRYRHRHWHR